MRKMVYGRQLGRSRKARLALFRTLVRSLVLKEAIVTTKAKAKSVVPLVEKLMTLSKKSTIASRRRVLSEVGNQREVVDKLLTQVTPSFKEKNSGFLRITPLPKRRGDASDVVRIEWTEKINKQEERASKNKIEKAKQVKTTKKEVSKKPVKKAVKEKIKSQKKK